MNRKIAMSASDYIHLATELQERQKLEPALAAYQTAIELDVQQPAWVYKNIGDILQQQQQLETAIEMYHKATAVAPSYMKPEMYIKIGDVLNRQGKLTEAKAAHKQYRIELSKYNISKLTEFLSPYCQLDGETVDLDLLDNGCEETGMQLSLLADKIKGRVVGTNIGNNFPDGTVEHRRKNTEFYWMDGQQLTFSNCSFDIVMSLNILEHVASPIKYLKECCRVLRSGGVGYFSWYPIWSSATGHHVHPDMVSMAAENLGIEAPTNYNLDGTTIPLWGHLLLNYEEMLSLLIEQKQYEPSLAKRMVNYIYDRDDINRWFWDDIFAAFDMASWKVMKFQPSRRDIPPQISELLKRKYGQVEQFAVSGCQIVVQKI